ncbi:MAG TPA: hypothetical protein PK683_13675, partial [Leptospiraceae bacterium]|nr:hypothetical protein [Leptospiraceae bacterium]
LFSNRLNNALSLLLSACMLMGIFREGFDMIMALHFSSLSLKEILQALSFLIFILPYAAALKKLLVISRGETG